MPAELVAASATPSVLNYFPTDSSQYSLGAAKAVYLIQHHPDARGRMFTGGRGSAVDTHKEHPRSARSALEAVDLARAGLVAPHDGLEGAFGYHALIEPLDLARYVGGLGQVWRIAEISVKPYPSGRASHGALGALAALRAEGLASLETTASIELLAPPLIHRLVGRPWRAGAAQSYNRLCLPFLAPLMLRDGHIDPRIAESAPCLAWSAERPLTKLDALSPQRLVLRRHDGSQIERAIPANPGSPQAPLAPREAEAKFALCRALACPADPRLFSDPLSYATVPA